MNLIKLSFPILMIIAFFAACGDDEIIIEQGPLGNCLANEVAESTLSDCENFTIDSSLICEVIVVQDNFLLKENYTEWLPFYCGDAGTRYSYENAAGESTFIQVENKRYSLINSLQNSFEECDITSDRSIFYCINTEVATVECSSPELNLDFNIILQNEFQRPLALPLKRGALLMINTVIVPDMNSTIFDIVTHFRWQVVEDELDVQLGSNQIYFSEIDILGTTFSDVYTYEAFNNDKAVQIFYSKDLGIVSFIGDDGTQWKIKS